MVPRRKPYGSGASDSPAPERSASRRKQPPLKEAICAPPFGAGGAQDDGIECLGLIAPSRYGGPPLGADVRRCGSLSLKIPPLRGGRCPRGIPLTRPQSETFRCFFLLNETSIFRALNGIVILSEVSAGTSLARSASCPPWFWVYLMPRKKITHRGTRGLGAVGPGFGLAVGASLRKATLTECDPAPAVCISLLTIEIF
jgi:hypothetical protein